MAMRINKEHCELVIDHTRLFPAQIYTHHEPGPFSCSRRRPADHRPDGLYRADQAGADTAESGVAT